MLREKSCGVVPFREVDGEVRYLVISSAVTKREHWEFPKGGVEEGEREIETALRELEEETGVSDVRLMPGFRAPIRYIYRRPEGLVFKQVIYFIGRVGDPKVTLRIEEAKDYRWANYEEARVLLRHGNAKELLYRCHAVITGNEPPVSESSRKRGAGVGGGGGGGGRGHYQRPAPATRQPRPDAASSGGGTRGHAAGAPRSQRAPTPRQDAPPPPREEPALQDGHPGRSGPPRSEQGAEPRVKQRAHPPSAVSAPSDTAQEKPRRRRRRRKKKAAGESGGKGQGGN